jgi:proteasome beta subunit
LGAQFQAVGYAASGSGSGTIRSILSFQERFGQPLPSRMNLPDAVRFASRLLTTASEFDSATGGVNPDTNTFATIKVLRPGGVETITDEQQKEILRP